VQYHNVIYVDYDPGVYSLANIRGISYRTLCETDLVVIKRKFAYKKTGLYTSVRIVEKDRYQSTPRSLTSEELRDIMIQAEKFKIVTRHGPIF
jgi:hypothetical protein